MAATIKDVARLAGVSPSTVSRVLNQKGVISDETKQKIASAMEQLKYVPNDIARSFANGSTHAISLVIDISDGTAYANNFFNNTVFGIETAAHQNDYNLIITNGAAAFGGISSVERLIAGKKVDGVVLPISLVTDELLRRIYRLGGDSYADHIGEDGGVLLRRGTGRAYGGGGCPGGRLRYAGQYHTQ